MLPLPNKWPEKCASLTHGPIKVVGAKRATIIAEDDAETRPYSGYTVAGEELVFTGFHTAIKFPLRPARSVLSLLRDNNSRRRYLAARVSVPTAASTILGIALIELSPGKIAFPGTISDYYRLVQKGFQRIWPVYYAI